MKKGTIILLLIILIVLLFHSSYWSFVMDDAFISFRYARNLIAGKGLVYNPGERVEGYTNFLWVVIIAIFMGLGATEVVFVAKMLGVLFGIINLWLVFKFSERFFNCWRIFNLLAPFLLAINRTYAGFCTGGLEIQLFLTLTFGAIFLTLKEQEGGNLPWSSLVFALSAMTRPEGFLFWLLIFFAKAILVILKKESASRFIIWASLFVLIFGAYFLWRWSYFGYFLPNTFYAKVHIYPKEGKFYSGAQIHQGWIYLKRFSKDYHIHLLCFLIPIAFIKNQKKWFVFSLFIFIIMVYSLYLLWIGGDFMEFRFMLPILPIFYLLVQEGLKNLWQFLPKGKFRSVSFAITLSLLFFTCWWTFLPTLFDLSPLTEGIHPLQALKWYTEEVFIPVGKWMSNFVQPGESIATRAIGAIGYYTDVYMLDMHGLTDPKTSHKKAEFFLHSHSKIADLNYVKSKNITYIIADPATSLRLEPLKGEGAIACKFPAKRYGKQLFFTLFTTLPEQEMRNMLISRGVDVLPDEHN